ncbi:Indoleamine 2,3-dioxygenase [Punctularia strigosozonata HHB-11173 SS5]|uniref:Indoleamine 2,3-dioxygenase n=1 Tax=Punctularia strigosozonata (strain HHB-11173) TaxID=741275 RepID=UPI00044172D4|nr:Indoleamine 2,3-dioxygenase [Punctularia strigosozonata HHB-11173 SS5]EIN09085.1 Indoleamine 2,3-dioxygenase [Punctularia strigosozonata HHB-11173 SS5]
MSVVQPSDADHHDRCEPPSLEDFDIDPTTGFFPPQPLPRLRGAFSIWEDALDDAKIVLRLNTGATTSVESSTSQDAGHVWRNKVRQWPVLSIDAGRTDLRFLQRAHMVLAFVMHFYVHSADPSAAPVVPRSIAVPLVSISNALGTAPVLTYADTVLWNARPIDADLPLSCDNIEFEHLFSGTPDEHAFYMASARVELLGVHALHIIHRHHHLLASSSPSSSSSSSLASDLEQLVSVIDALSDAIAAVRSECDPHVFYHAIRPWFCGSDARGPGGWALEGAPEARLLSGPSGGQSALVHALDAFLDVDHALARSAGRAPAPSAANARADLGFMARMRLYMPARHRAYLQEAVEPVRERARREGGEEAREAYNAAVGALRRLRDGHIRVACLYIVAVPQAAARACPVMARLAAQEEAGETKTKAPARGTGGLAVALQLKAGRDATRRAAL